MNSEFLKNENYWDSKYINASKENKNPPWESKEVFHVLKDYFNKEGIYASINDNIGKKLKILEVGCGASNSCIWLAEQGHDVTGIDFSSEAIKRAKEFDKNGLVNWLIGDLLDDNFFEKNNITIESFDLILDMQCYHCLRLIDEEKYLSLLYKLMKNEGKLMLVVGAFMEPYTKGRINDKINNNLGPNLLEIDDFLIPFNNKGLTLKSLKLSKFNDSIITDSISYSCWVSIFKK